jgi:hypothetical protein
VSSGRFQRGYDSVKNLHRPTTSSGSTQLFIFTSASNGSSASFCFVETFHGGMRVAWEGLAGPSPRFTICLGAGLLALVPLLVVMLTMLATSPRASPAADVPGAAGDVRACCRLLPPRAPYVPPPPASAAAAAAAAVVTAGGIVAVAVAAVAIAGETVAVADLALPRPMPLPSKPS